MRLRGRKRFIGKFFRRVGRFLSARVYRRRLYRRRR